MEKTVRKMNPQAKELFLAEIKKRIPDNPEEKSPVLRGRLKMGNNFSIDGLICEAYLKAHNLDWDAVNPNAILGSTHAIPQPVRDWAGLDRIDPYIEVNGNITTLAIFADTQMPLINEKLYNLMDKNF